MTQKVITDCFSFFVKLFHTIRWGAVFLYYENWRNYVPFEKREKALRILANGPSLSKEMEQIEKSPSESDYCLVNFSFREPLFSKIRPTMYVLADPAFFGKKYGCQAKDCFEKVDWDMMLYIPYRFRRMVFQIANPHVKVVLFHKGEYKGFENVKFFLYKKGLSMPRPQNVVAAAIFNAINAGYKKIELYGVDHSWTKDMVINDYNEVCSVDSHYYDTKKATLRPSNQINGVKKTLHETLRNLALAFETYHKLREYANYRGVEVLTMTKGSFIDAFKRGYKID